MFQNSPQMKMSRMNRTKNIVLHRMYKKWTPDSASQMGRFNITVLACNICMFFYFIFFFMFYRFIALFKYFLELHYLC